MTGLIQSALKVNRELPIDFNKFWIRPSMKEICPVMCMMCSFCGYSGDDSNTSSLTDRWTSNFKTVNPVGFAITKHRHTAEEI